jgi:hypothetical protein
MGLKTPGPQGIEGSNPSLDTKILVGSRKSLAHRPLSQRVSKVSLLVLVLRGDERSRNLCEVKEG